MTPLPSALEPLAGLPRWVGWKIAHKAGGKPRKLPIDAATGKAASSTAPATWTPFAQATAAVPRHRLRGVGITLGDLGDGRWLIGGDFDLCRSPVTGEIMPWAREKIDRWSTYAEVLPSGTGVKLFGYTTRPIEVPTKEITIDAPIPEGAEGGDHDKPEIGLYPSGRYFTVTGQALDGCPDHLADVTEAVTELAAEMAAASAKPKPRARKRNAEPEAEPVKERPALDPEALADLVAGLPRELAELIDTD